MTPEQLAILKAAVLADAALAQWRTDPLPRDAISRALNKATS